MIGGLALSTPITLCLVPALLVAVLRPRYRLAPAANASAGAPLTRRSVAA